MVETEKSGVRNDAFEAQGQAAKRPHLEKKRRSFFATMMIALIPSGISNNLRMSMVGQ